MFAVLITPNFKWDLQEKSYDKDYALRRSADRCFMTRHDPFYLCTMSALAVWPTLPPKRQSDRTVNLSPFTCPVPRLRMWGALPTILRAFKTWYSAKVFPPGFKKWQTCLMFYFAEDMSVLHTWLSLYLRWARMMTPETIRTSFVRPSLHRYKNRGRWQHRWCHHIVWHSRCHDYFP